jgi:Concanavalin A-like lectin/glucanases superfamily
MRLAQKLLAHLLTAVACGAAAYAAMTYGYFRMFSMFAAYDDEGYVMQTVQSYLSGHRLYDEVFSQYGPAFYLLQSVVHGFLRVPVTHDAVRLLTLGLWLGASVAAAGIVFRLSRSIAIAALAFVGAFVTLIPLINEPGHPQNALVFAVLLACLIVASDRGEITRRHAWWCGALTAFAVCCKINVGAFLFLGLAIPFALASPFRHYSGPVALVLAPCIPLIVFRDHIAGQAANYAVTGALSMASATLASYRLFDPSLLRPVVLRAYATAFALGSAVIVLLVIAQGTTISALFDAMIVQPVRFARVFYMPAVVPRGGIIAGAVGIALAAALTWRRLSQSRLHDATVFVAKLSFAAGTFYALSAGYDVLMGYVTPFVWIVMLPIDTNQSPRAFVSRGVLAVTAVMQFLQAYPVAGTQVACATVLLLPAACLSLSDAITLISSRLRRPDLAIDGLRVATLVWAWTFYKVVIGPDLLRHYSAVYSMSPALRLPGTTRIHLPRQEVATYQWLVGTLSANCGSLVTLPGLQSLEIWTGLPPVTIRNATAWMLLFSAGEQQRIWQAVDAAKNPCAVFQQRLAVNWVGPRVERLPAYENLVARFHAVASISGYDFMVRADGPSSENVLMHLIAGRQTFDRDHSALPVTSDFIYRQPQSTIRAWIRSRRKGVILACQSQEEMFGRPRHSNPLLYIGNSGRLYGQYFVGDTTTQSTPHAVNNGDWHHVAIVRSDRTQTLYVDGEFVSSLARAILDLDLRYCQAGIGLTADWPDASFGWMTFNGEIEGLAVARRAWSAEDVVRDRLASQPRE